MAIRLSRSFGSRAEIWLALQFDHDMAKAGSPA
ncbi:hypothetical protein N825_15400 [Skermanella stibiiresistens SB22]|uniref:Uncharacterized protein n=1 Tax=Skermanella stibiiresistens SB22 TaxID=1385369 RepID=W9GVZ7_9PROT|nr:hypothetical protein N825_15400 [Skermanella stibiiresistens SB22]